MDQFFMTSFSSSLQTELTFFHGLAAVLKELVEIKHGVSRVV